MPTDKSDHMPAFGIIYGSQSGNTALVAEAVASRLGRDGIQARLFDGKQISAADLANYDRLIVCTSSHGNGELPDNLVALHADIAETRPDLSHLRYIVFAIGDMTYAETFCGAGRRMEDVLAATGAIPIAPMIAVDVSEQVFAEEPVIEWLDIWLASQGGPG